MSNVRWSAAFTNADVDHIASNLREVDRYEALSFGCIPGKNEGDYIRASAIALCFWYRDRPAFLLGAIETVPGIFTIWGHGTDDTWRVLPEMAKVCRGYVVEYLFKDRHARRLAVHLPYVTICEPNIRWLKRVGFIPESVAPYSTIDDEPVITLAVTKVDYLNHVRAKNAKI